MVGGGKDREEMSRLIDVDALLTKVRQIDFLTSPNSTKISACEIMAIINKQPTAFDTEKVVEQLEEVNMNYFLTIANTGSEKLDIAYGYASDSINKAIDIVKKGGVE